jgi:tRNA threonylcarbamoyladenosine biosynthesis protein TsaB
VLILALDTSSTSGSIALVSGSRLISEWTVGDVGTHADWLMRNVAAMLSSRGITPQEIDLFAATQGPGSFTGLRIGITTLKGLAWTSGKKVVGVSTLEVLARNFTETSMVVCPVLDARKAEVYTALYRTEDGRPRAVLEDSALPPSELVARIEGLRSAGEIRGPVLFTGSGLDVYGKTLLRDVEGAVAAPEPLWHVRASNVALAAVQEHGRAVQPTAFTPVYLRKSEAELKAKKSAQKV